MRLFKKKKKVQTLHCQQAASVGELKKVSLDVVQEFTCCTGGAAWSIGRNLPAIHVCQADVWVQTHIKVIATEIETDRQGHFLHAGMKTHECNSYFADRENES